ncbi:MAG: hypothetical protein HC925_08100 [Coleofasciculaceae cyanobacterium SM2_3_26]|nr:hypothetical protein [Coleofasciculaceae cyanobacterium SM2_3_26]
MAMGVGLPRCLPRFYEAIAKFRGQPSANYTSLSDLEPDKMRSRLRSQHSLSVD